MKKQNSISQQKKQQNNSYSSIQSRYKETKKIQQPLNSSGLFDKCSQNCLRIIITFIIQDYQDINYLKKTCRRFFYELQNNMDNYRYIAKSVDQSQIIEYLVLKYNLKKIDIYKNFNDKMLSLFQYGSTKLNLFDKLLNSMKLKTELTINKNRFEPKLLFRKLNSASHIYFKQMIENVPLRMKKDTYDELKLKLTITSDLLQMSHTIQKNYTCQEILQKSVKQKAFNFLVDGNILFAYFDQDNYILYMLFEYSGPQFMNLLWRQIKKKSMWKNQTQFQQKLQKLQIKPQQQVKSQSVSKIQSDSDSDSDSAEIIPFQQQKNVKIPPRIPTPQQQSQVQRLPPIKRKVTAFHKPKRIEQDFQYLSMQEYLNSQQDFELSVNIHTGITNQNLYFYLNTKACPKLDNDSLYFIYDVKERINNQYNMYLDNRLGMKDIVQNLYLCDVTLKDRDEFRILYSGFVQMYDELPNQVAKQYNNLIFKIKF
ncbi:hypothetical protein pb186bvf_012125 [Paramecium bursaria]